PARSRRPPAGRGRTAAGGRHGAAAPPPGAAVGHGAALASTTGWHRAGAATRRGVPHPAPAVPARPPSRGRKAAGGRAAAAWASFSDSTARPPEAKAFARGFPPTAAAGIG